MSVVSAKQRKNLVASLGQNGTKKKVLLKQMGGHQVPLFSPAVVKSTVQPFFLSDLNLGARKSTLDQCCVIAFQIPSITKNVFSRRNQHEGRPQDTQINTATKAINFAPPCQRPISASAASWHTSCLLPTVHLIQSTLFAPKKTHTNDFQAHN